MFTFMQSSTEDHSGEADKTMNAVSAKPCVAFGPALPGSGSWEWIGAELVEALSETYRTVTFERDIPVCDVLVLVKFPLSLDEARRAAKRCALIYAPVDYYGSCSEIDQDALLLRQCARIVVHCPKLAKYFRSYVPVECLDHHVRFAAPPDNRPKDGPILYVGVRSNLPPLVEYVNSHSLPRELVVLTNPESSSQRLRAEDFGFRDSSRVRVETWSPEAHLSWLSRASLSLDVKGTDFRQRHKPPTKAIDFIASGLPFATNVESSSTEYLTNMGFQVATPNDLRRWLSDDYRNETVQFGQAMTELFARHRVANRWANVIESVLIEKLRF